MHNLMIRVRGRREEEEAEIDRSIRVVKAGMGAEIELGTLGIGGFI